MVYDEIILVHAGVYISQFAIQPHYFVARFGFDSLFARFQLIKIMNDLIHKPDRNYCLRL